MIVLTYQLELLWNKKPAYQIDDTGSESSCSARLVEGCGFLRTYITVVKFDYIFVAL